MDRNDTRVYLSKVELHAKIAEIRRELTDTQEELAHQKLRAQQDPCDTARCLTLQSGIVRIHKLLKRRHISDARRAAEVLLGDAE